MNGAITEPCARISRPPSTSIATISGSSHSFFRTRRNAHSSRRNDMQDASELVLERLGRGARRIAFDPVGILGTATKVELVAAESAGHDGDRRDQHEEDDSKDDGAHDLAQQYAEREPCPIQWRQQCGADDSQDREDRRKGEEQPAYRRGPALVER